MKRWMFALLALIAVSTTSIASAHDECHGGYGRGGGYGGGYGHHPQVSFYGGYAPVSPYPYAYQAYRPAPVYVYPQPSYGFNYSSPRFSVGFGGF
jgi:hypothetical protein